jgi:hypothetical protein
MKVTTPYFVHIQTLTPEGPPLQGFPRPEPVSRNNQVASTRKIMDFDDPWNRGPVHQPYPVMYDNRDGRQKPMFARK